MLKLSEKLLLGGLRLGWMHLLIDLPGDACLLQPLGIGSPGESIIG
jgi:hypothetical protein